MGEETEESLLATPAAQSNHVVRGRRGEKEGRKEGGRRGEKEGRKEGRRRERGGGEEEKKKEGENQEIGGTIDMRDSPDDDEERDSPVPTCLSICSAPSVVVN